MLAHSQRAWLCLQDTAACNVAAAYTATLSDTPAILDALRTAHAALQNLTSGRKPVKELVEVLEPLPGNHAQIDSMKLSPDSSLCAISYRGWDDRDFDWRDPFGSRRKRASVHPCRIALYCVPSGIKTCTFVADSYYKCALKWSPCSSWLSVARSRWSEEVGSQQCSLSVVRAESWQTGSHPLPALGSPSTWFEDDGTGAWSNNARLYFSTTAGNSQPDSGCLYIRDAVQDVIVVKVMISWRHYRWPRAFGWHPSSTGLVTLAHWCSVPDPQPLWDAGFATGMIPERYYIGKISSHFSMQGGMLLATGEEPREEVILSCRSQGKIYQIEVLCVLGNEWLDQTCWAPFCDQQACLWIQTRTLILHYVSPERQHEPWCGFVRWPSSHPEASFSASGKYRVGQDERGSLCCHSGHQVVYVNAGLPEGRLDFLAWAPCGSLLIHAAQRFPWSEIPMALFRCDAVATS